LRKPHEALTPDQQNATMNKARCVETGHNRWRKEKDRFFSFSSKLHHDLLRLGFVLISSQKLKR
jgi:hypothetical protein